jgi:hypothetical protein
VLTLAERRHMKDLPPATALWLALGSHVRHVHTDYEHLLADGYEREAARFFVADETDAVLAGWGCQRSVSERRGEDEAVKTPACSRLIESMQGFDRSRGPNAAIIRATRPPDIAFHAHRLALSLSRQGPLARTPVPRRADCGQLFSRRPAVRDRERAPPASIRPSPCISPRSST